MHLVHKLSALKIYKTMKKLKVTPGPRLVTCHALSLDLLTWKVSFTAELKNINVV